MRRKLKAVGIVVLVGGVAAVAAARPAARFAEPALGYAAKVVCSQVFVGHVEEARAVADLPQVAVARVIRVRVDRGAGEVAAGVPLVARRQAVYRPQLGCTLEPTDGSAVAFPALPRAVGRAGASGAAWPAGEAVAAEVPEGVAADALEAAVSWAFTEPGRDSVWNTRAVVVVHEGRIVAERYAPGFGKETSFPGWSMAKSVNSALIGILVGEGRLGLEDSGLLEEWRGAGDGRGAITLDQLLRMSSGLEFTEDYGPLGDATRLLFATTDVAAASANRPLAHEPGAVWYYSSATSNVLSRIVREAVGGGVADYLAFPRRVLFDPVGMRSAVLEPDATGTFVASSFMYATARDWARFGLLYLRDGEWNGARVLPEGWVKYSVTPAPAAPRGRYGAQWWLNAGTAEDRTDRPYPALPADLYMAQGHEGQAIVVVPSRDLVVVRLGLTRDFHAWDIGQFMERVLAAF